MSEASSELAAAIADGVALLETSPSHHSSANNIEAVLKKRLAAYYTRRGNHDAFNKVEDLMKLGDIELLTAKEALSVLQRVQKPLDAEGSDDADLNQPPPIGTRDLAKLRTLLSLVFKWGIQPLYGRVILSWPTAGGSKIVDLGSHSEDYQALSNLTTSLFTLIFPQGVEGRISQTLITSTILARHVADLLTPAIVLGWLPEVHASGSTPVIHELRPMVMRMMRLLSPAQTIASLGVILSSTSPSPPLHARKACTSLLTKQLLRPDGVQGLCATIFSVQETTGDEARPEKLIHVARTLNSVPASMKPEEYYWAIFPRVIGLLTSGAPTPYIRAAAFTVYRAVVPEKAGPHYTIASSTVLALLHGPFLQSVGIPLKEADMPSLNPKRALASMMVLLTNTEPSPVFVSRMLSPVVPALYLLFFDLQQCKTADPQLKESVMGLLKSWGKITDPIEGSPILWSIIEGGKENEWKFDLEGNFWKSSMTEKPASALSMPGDPGTAEVVQLADIDQNLFDLYPDPLHFVEFLKMIERGDLASLIFVRLLESYRDMKGRVNEDPSRVLHKLQIIIQMQKHLSEGTTSNILRKPGHLLTFISHVLQSSCVLLTDTGNTSFLDDDLLEGDSDDEAPDSEVIGPDDELIETTITLLLSILEADDTLSARTHPILNDIFSTLEPLALKGSSAIRPLARVARLVITARLANTSTSPATGDLSEEDDREMYQRALKLLQDPILPVRAHGLLLLREILSSPRGKGNQISKALAPSILSIFLECVQDEDSYIFLNAVRGLAVLVDKHGKDILRRLVHDYTKGLGGLGSNNLTQQGIDTRTRIGEALSSVIRHCGSALGIYVDMLVPPLFTVVRTSTAPTALRTSALSLLGDCVDTYALAMLPYVEDLCQALIDLLQVEGVSSRFARTVDEKGSDETQLPSSMDLDPTSKNPKFPPLRRAALHFLSLLIRSTTKNAHDEGDAVTSLVFSPSTLKRVNSTLGYISSTDEDNIVRVMARETKENLEQLQRAVLGI
ncbi:unnamed protein product [Cyclocybe aegerita]|uniref:RNA polymerase II assembly factor Rtp1 C-terminal domain-containing protein n=1 Tax=Cyclocybe aegerita TaxID=1973307 RepID=A0A8S0WKP0_CYCAE|nr:unnamed protein product [Cyclocybe aegerita]